MRTRAGRPARRRRHRRPPGEPARARARADGRHVPRRARLPRRRGAGAARRVDHARLPERDGHGEPLARVGACARHLGDRQRGARTRDRRPRAVPHHDGRADRRRRLEHDRDPGCRRAARRGAHGGARPDRGGHVGGGGRRDARRRHDRQRSARASRAPAGEARRRRGDDRDERRRSPCAPAHASAGDGPRHVAVPGHRHRLPADPARDARRRRRHEHRRPRTCSRAGSCTSANCGGWAPTSVPRATTR